LLLAGAVLGQTTPSQFELPMRQIPLSASQSANVVALQVASQKQHAPVSAPIVLASRAKLVHNVMSKGDSNPATYPALVPP
jgi:2-keto-4-pentenoate hydratase